ncbi:MAG: glutamate racemase [Nitrososphaerales archaeon]
MERVGVFDSGVGGLSVVREMLVQMPGQPLVYLADQANAPYGQRSLEEIRALSDGITRFLLGQGCGVIVVACNTASAAALRCLRHKYPDIPFVGMEPAVKPAAERTHTRHVGVMATPATFQSELFASLVDRFGKEVTVHTQVCPDLVPLVEAGELETDRARDAVQRYVEPLVAAGVDELVLGCTHYPFLRPLIEEAAGPEIEVLDPAPAVARQAARVLAQYGWRAAGSGPAEHSFFTTGDAGRFTTALGELLRGVYSAKQAAWHSGGLR